MTHDNNKQLHAGVEYAVEGGERVPLSCRLHGPVNIADAATIDAVDEKARALDAQIEKLANFIIEEIPGEPSQSEGAVDTAIRWMRAALSASPVQEGK